jgi:hypothetical protein
MSEHKAREAQQKTVEAHNAALRGTAESIGSAGYLSRPPTFIPEALRVAIARACKTLEEDMWDRLKRHADVADLKVVIDRAIEEWVRK